MERLDRSVREQLSQWAQHTDRLLAGKMQKGAFAEVEKQCRAKIDEIKDKMDSAIYSL